MLHSYKLHPHALFGFAPLYERPRPYLPCRHIEQQLDESSGRRRFKRTNI
jgi:hypothetical protein